MVGEAGAGEMAQAAPKSSINQVLLIPPHLAMPAFFLCSDQQPMQHAPLLSYLLLLEQEDDAELLHPGLDILSPV